MLLATASASPSWTPAERFNAGEKGYWFDPSDLSTMFQDDAGTTPVTASGQPVKKMLDKSGAGNHLVQSTTSQAPLLQHDGTRYYLDFDGVNDSMIMAVNMDLGSGDAFTLLTGWMKKDTNTAVILELSVDWTPRANATFILVTTSTIQPGFAGNNSYYQPAITNPGTGPVKLVMVTSADFSTVKMDNRLNGSSVASSPSWSTATVSMKSDKLYVGARSNNQFFTPMRLYQMAGFTGYYTSEISKFETWINSKTGAF